MMLKEASSKLQCEEENLHCADDREASEKSQCPTDGREFVNIFGFFVLNLLELTFSDHSWCKSVECRLTMVTWSNVEVSKKILTK